jgi:uncharacterized protein (DUF1800 family)
VEDQNGEEKRKNQQHINENHARELNGTSYYFTKSRIHTRMMFIELAKIMSGWRPKWSKSNRSWFSDVKIYDHERHEPGKKIVLGKEYKSWQ